ncbi:hypothetical protein RRG08_060286 [Elysia crispata]|uniref:Uncharacterized protein n=1 Tax=Elysia crispata TaxID=231223 RepID=A0AAE1AC91_9GAST|nr:hypothetical protein RRG08_060286 [Elysia crispata]
MTRDDLSGHITPALRLPGANDELVDRRDLDLACNSQPASQPATHRAGSKKLSTAVSDVARRDPEGPERATTSLESPDQLLDQLASRMHNNSFRHCATTAHAC